MIGACGDAASDEVAVAFEKNDAHVATVADEDVAIGALECRAGNDAVLAVAPRGVDPAGNGAQPWPAIGVIRAARRDASFRCLISDGTNRRLRRSNAAGAQAS